jgi:hypothetical protein
VSNETPQDSEDAADGSLRLPWYPVGPVDSTGSTDADKIDADRFKAPDVCAGLQEADLGFATDADTIDFDSLVRPPSVAGVTDREDGRPLDAERIDDGIEQSSSVEGLTNLNYGQATDAQKIDTDGRDQNKTPQSPVDRG